MARHPHPEPTPGELEILEVLWRRSPLELSKVWQALNESREVAKTTVATLLKVMEGKGLIGRDKGAGRVARWSPVKGRGRTGAPMLRRVIDRVFDGSARTALQSLLDEGELSAEELSELRTMLSVHRPGEPG